MNLHIKEVYRKVLQTIQTQMMETVNVIEREQDRKPLYQKEKSDWKLGRRDKK